MPTYIARRKRTRVLYVVLLCVAIAMSTWAIYNQLHSDSTSAQFADQINTFCEQNPAYVGGPLNCKQAKDAQNDSAPIITAPKGDKGDKGEKGDPGPKGDSIMGPKGDPGTNGTNGTNGQNGHDGNDGQNGQDGQSIEGPKGDKGDVGEKGDKGDPGERGADAPRIVSEDLDMDSCTGTGHLSDGTSFPINMTGCTPPLIGRGE